MLPDPNESWGNFFRRVMNFEIYQPPLVDNKLVPLEKRGSAFMKMQTWLVEKEYNKKRILYLKSLVSLTDVVVNDVEFNVIADSSSAKPNVSLNAEPKLQSDVIRHKEDFTDRKPITRKSLSSSDKAEESNELTINHKSPKGNKNDQIEILDK